MTFSDEAVERVAEVLHDIYGDRTTTSRSQASEVLAYLNDAGYRVVHKCDGSDACKAESHIHGCYGDHGSCDAPDEHDPTPVCDGRCLTATDLGVTGYGDTVAYPDPDCSLHGAPKRCMTEPVTGLEHDEDDHEDGVTCAEIGCDET